MISAASRWFEAGERCWLAGIRSAFLRTALCRLLRFQIFLFFPSIAFVTLGLLPSEFAWTASPVLFLFGTSTLLSELRSERRARTIVTALGLWAGFIAVEYLGVRTGIPFGHYSYTDTLGFALAGIPVAIGAAWYAAIVNAWRIAEWLAGGATTKKTIMIPLIAALLTLAFDIALEPMASNVREYWIWSGGTIPLQNYASWFVLSFIVVYILRRHDASPVYAGDGRGATGALLFTLQFLLFVLTDLFHGHLAAVAASLTIIAGLGVWYRWQIRLTRPVTRRRREDEQVTSEGG